MHFYSKNYIFFIISYNKSVFRRLAVSAIYATMIRIRRRRRRSSSSTSATWSNGSVGTASFRSSVKRELNVYCIASFSKSETGAWHISIRKCATPIGREEPKIQNYCPIGVVHFEYFTEPMRVWNFVLVSSCVRFRNSYIGYIYTVQ